jgi:hypothetical protein
MAQECSNLKAEVSTRERFKMASKMGMASTLGLMGTNMTAAGTRVIDMELVSKEGLMEAFKKAAG